ncbi:hypothetical protein BH11ACT2_BH11ACT2_11170 [soil metagenome]
MQQFTPEGRLGKTFWLLVVAATSASLANGTVSPLIPLYIEDRLHGTVLAAGLFVGVGSLVGLLSQPLVGMFADRRGYKMTWVVSSILGIVGILLMLDTWGLAPALASRALFGIAGATSNTVMSGWVIGTVVAHARGKGLGLFGVSVWVGLGVGPPLGRWALGIGGYSAVWVLSAVLLTVGILTALPLYSPPPGALPAVRAPWEDRVEQWRSAVKSVALPGVVAALAWSAEGVILTFLILHLHKQGLATGGLFGATSVFSVFAGSVIIARLLLSSVTDRLGALLTTVISLSILGVALVVLAVARTFAAAAVAGVLLGFAFAPLYPALTLMANDNLSLYNRARGLGIFSALTALGITAGSVYGGLLSSWAGEGAAFVGAAVMQLIAIALVLARARQLRARARASRAD